MTAGTWLPYAAAALALTVLVVAPRLWTERFTRPAMALAVRVAVLAVIGLVLALLTDAAAEGDGLTVIDRPVWSWLIAHRTGTRTTLARAVSDAGGTAVMGGLAAVVAVVLFLRHRRADAVVVASTTAGAGLIVTVTKPIVGRVRPPVQYRLVTETNPSFPSGHAVASAAVIGVLAAVLVPLLRRRALRVAVWASTVLVVLAVGVSRLYLGVHWPTDVIGGWLAGSGWLLACLTVARAAWAPRATDLDSAADGRLEAGAPGAVR